MIMDGSWTTGTADTRSAVPMLEGPFIIVCKDVGYNVQPTDKIQELHVELNIIICFV